VPRLPARDWLTSSKNPYETHNLAVKKRIMSCRTKYQEVAILDTYAFGRVLLLDNAIQSSEVDEFIYHEVLVHPVLCALEGENLSVLIIGGGEGATLREVLRHRRVDRAVMVDIDKEVVNLCRKYLPQWSQGAFEDRRAEIIYDDGKTYLENTGEKFDAIICDLTEPSPTSNAAALYQQDFFRQIDAHLNNGGLFCTQGTSTSLQDMAFFALLYHTIESLFPIVRSMRAYIPSYGTEYGFICASHQIDPSAITKGSLRRKLREKIDGKLHFYDSSIHHALFALPPYLKSILASKGDILG